MSRMSTLYATALPAIISTGDFDEIDSQIIWHKKFLEDASIGVICDLFKDLINSYLDIPLEEYVIDYMFEYFQLYITRLCNEYRFGGILEEGLYKMGFDLIAYYLANSNIDLDMYMSSLYSILINTELLNAYPSLKREIPSGLVLDLIDQITFYTTHENSEIVGNLLGPIEYYIENRYDVNIFIDDLIIGLLSNLNRSPTMDLKILKILNRITLIYSSLEAFLQLKIVLYDFILEHTREIRTYAISILHRLYLNYPSILAPISIVFLFQNLIKHTDRMAIHLLNTLLLDKHQYTLKMWKENNMNSFTREHPVKCMRLLLNKNTFETLKDRAYSVSLFRGDPLPWFLEEKHSGEINICAA